MARLGAGFTTKKVGSRTVIVAQRGNKYGAVKRTIDGIIFDSIKESKRYGELKIEMKAGRICQLEVHKVFRLYVNEIYVCDYESDFSYMRFNGSLKVATAGARWVTVVEDVKSKATRTRLYVLKKKLMQAVYGIEIVEV